MQFKLTSHDFNFSPPDYVKISVVLLLLAPPCAGIALYWAIKAHRHMQRGQNRIAWHFSNKVSFITHAMHVYNCQSVPGPIKPCFFQTENDVKM